MLTNPGEIEKRSMEIISAELRQQNAEIPEEHRAVLLRVIHTSADFDYVQNLAFTSDAVEQGIHALLSGIPILTDTTMALSGISKLATGKLGVPSECWIRDPDVMEAAASNGTTRSAEAVHKAVRSMETAIFAVGNAPTALMALSGHIRNGFRPALVIGVPVGFVNVVEAKEEILSLCREFEIPAIVARGRKGGSNVAAAICNALLYQATDMLDPFNRKE